MRTKTLWALLLPLLLFISSCEDNSPDEIKESEKTAEESKKDVSRAFYSVLADLSTINKGTGMQSLQELMSWEAGDGQNSSSEAWVEMLFMALDEAVIENIGEDSMEDIQRLQMSRLGGIYVWNSSTAEFDVTESEDKFEVQMPSDVEQPTNNLVITFSGYEDTQVNWGLGEENEMVYLPLKGDLTLKIDGELIFGFHISKISYDTENMGGYPTEFKASVTMSPATFYIDMYQEENNTKTVLDFSMFIAEKPVLGVKGAFTVANSDYINFEESDLKDLDIELTINDLMIDIQVPMDQILMLDNPTESQINNLVNGQILYQGEKVADLVFSQADETLYFEYRDGSREDAFAYIEMLLAGFMMYSSGFMQ